MPRSDWSWPDGSGLSGGVDGSVGGGVLCGGVVGSPVGLDVDGCSGSVVVAAGREGGVLVVTGTVGSYSSASCGVDSPGVGVGQGVA